MRAGLKDAILVGHSTGGGEVARYIARHGTKRIAKAVLIGAIPPLRLNVLNDGMLGRWLYRFPTVFSSEMPGLMKARSNSARRVVGKRQHIANPSGSEFVAATPRRHAARNDPADAGRSISTVRR